VIRVYGESGAVIEAHEHNGDFKEWDGFAPVFANAVNSKLLPVAQFVAGSNFTYQRGTPGGLSLLRRSMTAPAYR
jgi:hypothetical protein